MGYELELWVLKYEFWDINYEQSKQASLQTQQGSFSLQDKIN